MTTATALKEVPQHSLVTKLAARFNVEPNKLMHTLKQTAFKVKGGEASNEQMMALLIVADQYGLNPFTKEIFAFPDKSGGVVPVVGIDGWSRIINQDPEFDGMEFETGVDGDGALVSITCTMYRKDRSHPTKVTELLKECKRSTEPWASHPSRMLRHKAMIQCARIAFGFVGIYDEDEAQRIIEGESVRTPESSPSIAAINGAVTGKTIEGEQQEPPTYAEIADAITKAANKDAVDLAVSVLHIGLTDAQHAELVDLAKVRRLEVAE